MTLDGLRYLNGLVARTEAARGLYLHHKSSELYFVYHELWRELKAEGIDMDRIRPPVLTPVPT